MAAALGYIRCALLESFFLRTVAGKPDTSQSQQVCARNFSTDCSLICASRSLPANVKDEPRPWPARRVRHHDLDSAGSFRNSFDSTRRDGHGRWLWRLVRRREARNGLRDEQRIHRGNTCSCFSCSRKHSSITQSKRCETEKRAKRHARVPGRDIAAAATLSNEILLSRNLLLAPLLLE